MHVLRVARIDNLYRVAIDDVSIVPLSYVRHVVVRPSAYGRLAARQRALDDEQLVTQAKNAKDKFPT